MQMTVIEARVLAFSQLDYASPDLALDRIARLSALIAMMHPSGIRRAIRLLQPLDLPVAQLQQLSRFADAHPPLYRILYYLDPLQLFLAQCHPPILRRGDRIPDQLRGDRIADQLQRTPD